MLYELHWLKRGKEKKPEKGFVRLIIFFFRTDFSDCGDWIVLF